VLAPDSRSWHCCCLLAGFVECFQLFLHQFPTSPGNSLYLIRSSYCLLLSSCLHCLLSLCRPLSLPLCRLSQALWHRGGYFWSRCDDVVERCVIHLRSDHSSRWWTSTFCRLVHVWCLQVCTAGIYQLSFSCIQSIFCFRILPIQVLLLPLFLGT
jgi:hypothetical protein